MTAPEKPVLELLRCPVTHSKLRQMDAEELGKLNQQIVAGNVKDRKGGPISAEVETCLVNDDQSIGWSIRGGILQLIADEGIDLGNVT